MSSIYNLLLQIATPTPNTLQVDPGNEPMGTAVFYILFMSLMIGGSVVGFRIRMYFTNKERARKKEEADRKAT
ncbi:MAG: hypothetical protein HXX08_07175 [Chloroflexi bacterium]|uniref:Uncharacterized protein n=1 Tax=Candidatus Chlorohelix allophototropha TaxID=3003348 RepID=A0A8T7LUF0_9CHLR|nr:hypothetical protein [Chloroflexota bacterium]WJW67514.1 hypothetical protein OZ401_000781 [Chloroflexota bacterium L227-S17]